MSEFAEILGPFRLLPMMAAVAGLAACSDIRPESDVREGGMLQSPTHQPDALHEVEREEEREGDRAE